MNDHRRRAPIAAALLALASWALVVSCSRPAPPAPGASVAVTPRNDSVATRIMRGSSVWTDVSVATLWTSPDAVRPVDAPALRAPVDIPQWLDAMSTEARRGLVGRVETQALLGERLVVTGVRTVASTTWLHVVAVDQATHRDPRGYPGWLPARQVTTTAPASTRQVATVVRRTAWLDRSGRRTLQVSFATRLPVVSGDGSELQVLTPRHAVRTIAGAAVVVRRAAVRAFRPSAAGVVATARTLLGVPYLWGGRSGFAVDCSGFTQLVFKLHGIGIPRDADDQARAGRAAAGTARAGDLVFFGQPVSHVGLVVGPGVMEHAPNSGSTVQTAAISVGTVAVRRYL